jgi:hypothetical protein
VVVNKLLHTICIRVVHALTRFAGQAELIQKLSGSFCRTAGVLTPLIDIDDKFWALKNPQHVRVSKMWRIARDVLKYIHVFAPLGAEAVQNVPDILSNRGGSHPSD